MEAGEVEKIVHEILPRLLTEHPEVRYQIEKLIEKSALPREEAESRFERLLNEIREMRLESERRWEEWRREWREERKRIWEEIERLRIEAQEERKLFREAVERLDRKIDRTIGALGARWGLMSEEAFRRGLQKILEDLTSYRVKRLWLYDERGEVFGHPDQVEIDVLIYNGEVWAVEIKSSVSREEVYAFDRKVRFYENREKRRVSRKLIISPMVDPRARDVAERLGVEIYTAPEDVKVQG